MEKIQQVPFENIEFKYKVESLKIPIRKWNRFS